MIDLMLDYSKVEKFPDVIPWDVYMKVMAKIHWQKKACFRNFIKAGRNFKFALYRLLNRMFLKEEFPKVSTEAQALIAFNASAFKLKTVWGDFHKVQTCLAPLCDRLDKQEHIKVCRFYKVKWEDMHNKDSLLLARYLAGVDRERRRRWRGECLS